MPAVPSLVYEVNNSNPFEVALNVAGSHLRLAPGEVFLLGTNNDSNDFPDIPGVSITKDPYPIQVGAEGVAYIPSGCKVSIFSSGPIGDGVETAFSITLTGTPIDPGSLVLLCSEGLLVDDGHGNLIPTMLAGANISSGTIDYNTGEINVVFDDPLNNASGISAYHCHRHSLHHH